MKDPFKTNHKKMNHPSILLLLRKQKCQSLVFSRHGEFASRPPLVSSPPFPPGALEVRTEHKHDQRSGKRLGSSLYSAGMAKIDASNSL